MSVVCVREVFHMNARVQWKLEIYRLRVCVEHRIDTHMSNERERERDDGERSCPRPSVQQTASLANENLGCYSRVLRTRSAR